jgi:DNA modification methylase
MKMEIKQVKLSEIKLNPGNPRRLSKQNMERLVKSLQEFPDMMKLREIVVDETMTILGGNMRALALRKSGAKECTAKIVTGLTPEQKREFIVKDNASFGEWNMEDLANSWADLPLADWGVDLPDDWLGADKGEPADAEPQIDRAEELNKTWRVTLGDLWQIGEHRLLCGDSTKKEDVGWVMGGEKAVLMNTDPPYGVAYVKNAKSKKQAQSQQDIENDDLDGEKLQKFLEETIRSAVPHLIENAAFYLWHPMLTQGTFFAAAAAADILIHRQIIWVKPSLVFGRGDYHWRHELCFYGWIKGNRPAFYGQRNQTTIWEVGRESDNLHPTQKPLELFNVPLLNHTKESELAYEPFGGSGSQFVACQNLNRKCRGIEISPDYCAVILQRMHDAFPGIEIKKIK